MSSDLRRHSSGLLLIVFMIQLFAFGLWAGGPRTDTSRNCVFNIQLGEKAGHSINCDSSEFLYAVAVPEQVLEYGSKRQSRPGTVLFVHVMTRPFVFAVETLAPASKKMMTFRDQHKDNEIAFEIPRSEFLISYMGYLFLHLLILMGTYALYLRLAGLGKDVPGRLKTAAAIAGLTVFINNVSKQFLWSPHTQLFNLLTPLLAMFLFVRMLKADRPDRMFVLAALGCGIGGLFYGTFALPIIVCGLAWLWRRKDYIADMKENARTLATGLFAMAVFILPYALWYGFIVLRNGTFYNYDVEYFRGFVWLPEVIDEKGIGAGVTLLVQNFALMFKGALVQGWGYALVLAGLVVAALRQKKAGGNAMTDVAALWWGAGLYSVLAAVFFAFYGLPILRLAFTITAVMLPLLGYYLHYVERHTARPGYLKAATIISVCAYTLFMLIKFGPYS
ncbi:MAG: hypothetical protein H6867_07215 [Rhodospirillales bacterium]|nr:hypothetical protein [Rhodospirillales bacterium]MCB9995340.1 hypothetical protein [Rhodospirillales bacterium]